MKILSLSTSDLNGGAPRAAYRLHQGLIKAGVDSQMLVQQKLGDEATVIGARSKITRGLAVTRPTLDSLPMLFYRQRDRTPYVYSCQWLPSKIDSAIEALNPDLINLHWVCGGYFPVEAIARFNRPLVWTLHDMWAFTGGCHYSKQCDRYQQTCGRCPILNSNRSWDYSRWLWHRKAKAWQNLDLTLVTPSKWLAECAKSSSLFRDLSVEVIPNGLDIHQYQPIDRQLARKLLELPQDKQIVLFGAIGATSDPRKGFSFLQAALEHLSHLTSSEGIELVVFGSSKPAKPIDFGFKTHYLGRFSDNISLALVYSAADVFIAPSVQDNLPNTIMEAMACGIPCVAFNVGGISDLVDGRQNGYLATPYEPQDLARGIVWILEDAERWQGLSHNAKAKVDRQFTIQIQADRYFQLFQKILAN